MPARNSRKVYLSEGYYHLYNRGVEKRDIFLDNQDYETFLSYLQEYLTPKDTERLKLKLEDTTLYATEKVIIRRALRLNNFSKELTMLSYCLMPNHFHFLIKQTKPATIDRFMNSLGTRYTMYFNKKYKRVGTLYQSVYKAAPLTNEKQFLNLSRYIHKQAYKTQPCSYEEYLGKKQTPWVNPTEILSVFMKKYPTLTYETFIKANDHTVDVTPFPTLED
jgi:putative transposase